MIISGRERGSYLIFAATFGFFQTLLQLDHLDTQISLVAFDLRASNKIEGVTSVMSFLIVPLISRTFVCDKEAAPSRKNEIEKKKKTKEKKKKKKCLRNVSDRVKFTVRNVCSSQVLKVV